jgi:hypothetical protein
VRRADERLAAHSAAAMGDKVVRLILIFMLMSLAACSRGPEQRAEAVADPGADQPQRELQRFARPPDERERPQAAGGGRIKCSKPVASVPCTP